MSNGRTSPVLLSAAQNMNTATDLVVKLNGGMDAGTAGAAYEVIASLLASRLNISCPEPNLVFISEELAELIGELNPSKASLMKQSVGWNFGSRMMKNFAIWPVDRTLPTSLVDEAADVFAFDALIQNPDRSYKNPNLGTQGDALQVFDHECAFSFLYNIFPTAFPWDLTAEHYLNDHVFVKALRNRANNWRPFLQLLAGIDSQFVPSIANELPTDWNLTRLPDIELHLAVVRDHSNDFELQLQRRCA